VVYQIHLRLIKSANYGILNAEIYHLKEESYGNRNRFSQGMGSDP
jgi:hypothetical protein